MIAHPRIASAGDDERGDVLLADRTRQLAEIVGRRIAGQCDLDGAVHRHVRDTEQVAERGCITSERLARRLQHPGRTFPARGVAKELASTACPSRSSAANAANVFSVTSCPSVVRARGRDTGTRRAPNVTDDGALPCRTTRRSGSCRPFAPARLVISAWIIADMTFSPVATLIANNPSRADAAASVSASRTSSGRSGRSRARSFDATRRVGILLMAVPFWSSFLAVARHLPSGRHQAGDRHSSPTRSGTTSAVALQVDREG